MASTGNLAWTRSARADNKTGSRASITSVYYFDVPSYDQIAITSFPRGEQETIIPDP